MLRAMLYCLKVTGVLVGEAYFAALLATASGYISAQVVLYFNVKNLAFLCVMIVLGSLPLFAWWMFLLRKGYMVLAGLELPVYGFFMATFFYSIYGESWH